MLDFNDEASREMFSTASSNEQVANGNCEYVEAWPKPFFVDSLFSQEFAGSRDQRV